MDIISCDTYFIAILTILSYVERKRDFIIIHSTFWWKHILYLYQFGNYLQRTFFLPLLCVLMYHYTISVALIPNYIHIKKMVLLLEYWMTSYLKMLEFFFCPCNTVCYTYTYRAGSQFVEASEQKNWTLNLPDFKGRENLIKIIRPHVKNSFKYTKRIQIVAHYNRIIIPNIAKIIPPYSIQTNAVQWTIHLDILYLNEEDNSYYCCLLSFRWIVL